MGGVRLLEWLVPVAVEETIDWDAVYREAISGGLATASPPSAPSSKSGAITGAMKLLRVVMYGSL